MVVNGYSLSQKSDKPTTYKPAKTGAMSSPNYGLFVLFISAVMIFTMDSFLGVGSLSLYLFGKSFDWDAAYVPLLTKLGVRSNNSAKSSELSEFNSNKMGDAEPLLGATRDPKAVGDGDHHNGV
jgi:hypothetical protein